MASEKKYFEVRNATGYDASLRGHKQRQGRPRRSGWSGFVAGRCKADGDSMGPHVNMAWGGDGRLLVWRLADGARGEARDEARDETRNEGRGDYVCI